MLAYGLKRLHQDGAHVLKARHQVHLGLHPLYLELDLIQPGVDADREVQEVGKLGQDGDVGPEVLDLQGYPVDLQLGDVQYHVWLLTVWLLAIWLLAIGWRSSRSREDRPGRGSRGKHPEAEPPEARRSP